MIELIKGLFSFAKTPTIKLVLILAIISAGAGFLAWSHHQIYQAGINAERVAQQQIQAKALGALEKQLSAKLQKATQSKQEWRTKAIELSNIKPVVQYEKIIEIINNDDCTNYGAAFVSLWNDRAEAFTKADIITGK